MILEGILTTCASDGRLHLAAMGPEVEEEEVLRGRLERLVLKPFAESVTAHNLTRQPEGVFHLTDDVLLVAQAVTGTLVPPACQRADEVQGWVLADACQAFEFRVVDGGTPGDRLRLTAEVVRVHQGRPFMGFNRGRQAVLEGAILVTRLHLLGPERVAAELASLLVLVEKTGGRREQAAFALLQQQVARHRERDEAAGVASSATG